MMAKELHKVLGNYFLLIEKLDEKWKGFSQDVRRPLEALQNFAEQFRHVTSKEIDNSGLCRVEELRERLIYKILMSLEDEMLFIYNILTQFNNFNQDVKNKLMHLENVRSKVSLKDPEMEEIIDGTPHRPRLNFLLQWAVESHQYYHELFIKINKSFKCLDYKVEQTIDDFVNSFVEDRFKRMKMDRILAYVQFFTKESVSST